MTESPELKAAILWAQGKRLDAKGCNDPEPHAKTLAEAYLREKEARKGAEQDVKDLYGLYEAEKTIKQIQWDYAREQKARAELAEAEISRLKEAKEDIYKSEAYIAQTRKYEQYAEYYANALLEISRLEGLLREKK